MKLMLPVFLALLLCTGCIHLKPVVEMEVAGPGLPKPAGEYVIIFENFKQPGFYTVKSDGSFVRHWLIQRIEKGPWVPEWMVLEIADAGIFNAITLRNFRTTGKPLPTGILELEGELRIYFENGFWEWVQIIDLYLHTLLLPTWPRYVTAECTLTLQEHVPLSVKEPYRVYTVKHTERMLATMWASDYDYFSAGGAGRAAIASIKACIQLMKRDLSDEKPE